MSTLPKRFASKFKIVESCWLWTACKNVWGYGKYGVKNRPVLAHRFSWIVYNGEIPTGMLVLHKCDTPACVNPQHLFLGTDKDNMADRDSKGRVGHPIGEKNGRSKLTKEQIEEIRMIYRRGEKGEYSQAGLAKKYGVIQSHIGRIVNNKAWENIKKESESA